MLSRNVSNLMDIKLKTAVESWFDDGGELGTRSLLHFHHFVRFSFFSSSGFSPLSPAGPLLLSWLSSSSSHIVCLSQVTVTISSSNRLKPSFQFWTWDLCRISPSLPHRYAWMYNVHCAVYPQIRSQKSLNRNLPDWPVSMHPVHHQPIQSLPDPPSVSYAVMLVNHHWWCDS